MPRHLLRYLAAAAALAMGLAAPGAARAQEPPTSVRIHEIQGRGVSSPLVGATVIVTGVVTADFVQTSLEGFFLQDPDGDGDPATSDGVWVYRNRKDFDVDVGDVAVVIGTVAEYYGLTEVALTSVVTAGVAAVPAPVLLDPPRDPTAAAAVLEAHEGMRVAIGPSVVVGATNAHGESYVVANVTTASRLFRADGDGRRIGLLPQGAWLGLDHGDRVVDVVGPLTYTYDNYKVAMAPDGLPRVDPGGRAQDRAIPAPAGVVSIAAYNLENLFDDIDDPRKSDPVRSPERYAMDLAVRARSIADNLALPDVVGVQEAENIEVLQALAAQPSVAAAAYGAALIDGPDERGIDAGLLYRRDRIALLSAEAHQVYVPPAEVGSHHVKCAWPDGSTGRCLYGRPPLAVRLEVKTTGQRFSVIVNHFKSKSGGDAQTTPVREAMARHNLELFEALKADRPLEPVFVIGDLNDFEDSRPLRALTETGRLRDPHTEVAPEEDYTYVFNGVSQNLDYILVETHLSLEWFAPIHCNADFGAVADDADDDTARRASDHDPVLARIAIAELGDCHLYLPLAARGSPVDSGGGGALPTPGPATPTATATAPATVTPTAVTPTAVTPTAATPTAATPTAVTPAPPRDPLRIVELFYDGDGQTEPNEYVAIRNERSEPVEMTGWRLISVRGNQVFDFPAGFAFEPGRTCRVYTNENHPEHCGLDWGSNQAVWRNSGDKAELRDASGALVDWFCYGDFEGQCG